MGVVCLASAGLADVVMAGHPVCPRGEEWGQPVCPRGEEWGHPVCPWGEEWCLDLKSSKSKTKHNSLCNCDYETCMTTYTCTCLWFL